MGGYLTEKVRVTHLPTVTTCDRSHVKIRGYTITIRYIVERFSERLQFLQFQKGEQKQFYVVPTYFLKVEIYPYLNAYRPVSGSVSKRPAIR